MIKQYSRRREQHPGERDKGGGRDGRCERGEYVEEMTSGINMD